MSIVKDRTKIKHSGGLCHLHSADGTSDWRQIGLAHEAENKSS